MSDDLAQWQQFLGRLDELGRPITSPPFPRPTPTTSKGCGTSRCRPPAGWRGRSGTRTHASPAFQRQNDLVLQWGGPNADNVYRHARVASLVAVSDRRDGCTRATTSSSPSAATSCTWRARAPSPSSSAHEHRPGSGRRLRDPARRRGRRAQPRSAPRGRAVGVDPRVLLRLATARAGHVHHRVPRRGRSTGCAFTSDDLAFGLAEAGTHLYRSLTYWNQYMLDARAAQTDNEFAGGYDVPRAASTRANYAFCFFDLAPDEALVVDCDVPDSRYWSFHLYNLAWWEALEYATRVTSLQPHPDRASATTDASASSSPTRIRASPTGSTPRAGARHSSRCGGSGRSAIRRRRRPGW